MPNYLILIMSKGLYTRKPETQNIPNVRRSERTFEYKSGIKTLDLRLCGDHKNTHTQIHDATI